MPASLFFLLRAAHLLAMAVWIGAPMFAPRGLRRAVAMDAPLALMLVRRMRALTPLFVAAALTTVGTGLALLFAAGGPGVVRPGVLIGAALAVVVFPIGGAVIRPTIGRLEVALRDGDAAAVPLARRFLAAHHAEQILRIAALVLMAIPFH
jgi:hypothetical protein